MLFFAVDVYATHTIPTSLNDLNDVVKRQTTKYMKYEPNNMGQRQSQEHYYESMISC